MSAEEDPHRLSVEEIHDRLVKACQYRSRQLVTEGYVLTMRDRRGIEVLVAELLRYLMADRRGQP